MRHIYFCITEQHDDRLVILAALVAVLGSYATFALLRRVETGAAGTRLRWLLASAVASGSAIWSTHFIGMLAYRPDAPTAFLPGPTVLSLPVAILLTGLSFGVALHGSRVLGGALAGCGIAVMHYLGMAALRVAGHLQWDYRLVFASIAAGAAFGALAFAIGLGGAGQWRRAAAAGLLSLSICVLHFTGMAAAVIVPDAAMPVPIASMPPLLLAIAVAAGGLLILGLGALALRIEQHDIRLRESERLRMQDLADAAVEGLLVCDGDTIVTANRSFVALVGRSTDALAKLRVADLVSLPLVADLVSPPPVAALARAGPEADPADGECVEGCLAAADEQIPVEMVTRTVSYAGRPHCVIAFRDLRARKRAEAHIQFLAQHDAVTGLANRARFLSRLEEELAVAGSRRRPHAVLALDIDRFKAVNDALGHAQGDALLRQVAVRLRALMREDDFVAALGADRFAVLQMAATQPQGAQIVAGRIADQLAGPYLIGGQPISLRFSIGVALSDAVTGDHAELLLNQADLALQRAKADGGNRHRFFDPALDERAQAARALELDLRLAVERDEFEVWFQPQLGLRTARVVGFEALVRWRHPRHGLIAPAEFIPLAEQTGLIAAIGAWVLRTAMTIAQGWPEQLSVAINLSPVQFRTQDLFELVSGALAASGLDPARLELEITESVLLDGNQAVFDVLHRLRERGVRIALDDFGIGFSSLSYLRSFPFDKIKIDRSFVAEVATSLQCQAIVRAIVGLGKSLRIVTTVEGVETEEQLAYVRREGCDEVQGYLVGRPQPVARFTAEHVPA